MQRTTAKENNTVLNELNALGFNQLIEPLLDSKDTVKRSAFPQVAEVVEWLQLQSAPKVYAVFIAKRFFNLFFGWKKLQTSKGKEVNFASNVIVTSDTGILNCAGDIADYYIDHHHELPRILFYDDFMISGDKLALCIKTLSEAICDALTEKGLFVGEDNLIDQLARSIVILVMGQGKLHDYVPLEIQWRTIACKQYETKERHQVSKTLSKLLTGMEVANTSGLLSAVCDSESKLVRDGINPKKEAWVEQQATFDKFKAKQYFYTKYSGDQLLPSIRQYEKRGKTYFTPFILHTEEKMSEVPQICSTLSRLMKDKQLTKIGLLLDSLAQKLEYGTKDYLANYAFQLSEMLLGQMLLRIFLQDCGDIDQSELTFDTDKLALYFGMYNIDAQEWKRFAACKWTSLEFACVTNVLRKQMDNNLSNSDATLLAGSKIGDALTRAANGVYYFAIKTKKQQLDLKEQQGNSDRLIRLKEYLTNMNKAELISCSQFLRYLKQVSNKTIGDMRSLISHVSLLVDLGYMSFCNRRIQNTIVMAFRHSEMSMYLYPQILKGDWTNVRDLFGFSSALSSRRSSLSFAADALGEDEKLRKHGSLFRNMANALEDERLVWSVLEWEYDSNESGNLSSDVGLTPSSKSITNK